MDQTKGTTRNIVSWLIYPISWLLIGIAFTIGWKGWLSYQAAWGGLVVCLVVSYMILERFWPLEQKWAMTWSSFKADLRFVLTNVAFIALLNILLNSLTISLANNRIGPAQALPLWVQFVSCLLIFEAINYALHRAMHEARGKTGKFLWAVHAAHHLPEKLYIFMHAVFHPINALFVQTFAMTLPIWLAGYDQKVVTLFLMINSMHGLISHFNVSVKMGWMNYIFVGPELHRYHHSADVTEAKNYGAVVPYFDLLFGSFVYKPERMPIALGVSVGSGLPKHDKFLKVMALPFKAAK